MKIQVEPHTLARAEERGASLNEIEETINTGISFTAKKSRLAKAKIFSFSSNRNGKFYEEKKLEVYYIVENNIIVTITDMFFTENFKL